MQKPRATLFIFAVAISAAIGACGRVDRSVEPDLQSNASYGGEHMVMSDASFGDGAAGGDVGTEALAVLNCHNAGVPFTGLLVKCSSATFGQGLTAPTQVSAIGKTTAQSALQPDGNGGFSATIPNVEVGETLMLSFSGIRGMQVGRYEIQCDVQPLHKGHALKLTMPVQITEKGKGLGAARSG